MQVSSRLLTAPECSACPSKRERPRHAPAPVTRLAMGAPKYQRRAALQNRCSKKKISNFSAASSTSAGVPACASGGVHFAHLVNGLIDLRL
eukprot:2198012-Pyramimonas_sp.AAC.1